MPAFEKSNQKKNTNEWIWLFSIFAVFLFVRIFCWLHAYKFEEIDSIGYLNLSKIIRHQDWSRLKPEDSLFYPALIAFFNFLGLKIEIAARSVSLFFSIILFFSVYFLGKKFFSFKSTYIGLIILALSPFLINFSISVLPDPSYIGLVYLGLAFFMYHIFKPNLFIGFFIGIIYGISFSDRTEGIVFIVLIPLFQLLHFIFWGKDNYSFSKIIFWISSFVIGFALIAVPIIVHTSNQMGTFSISGRTAWEELLKENNGKSYSEKLYGLDYSPNIVNIDYLIKHPEKLNKHETTENYYKKIKYFIDNISYLIEYQLSSLVGIFVIVFFAFGLYYIFIENKTLDLSLFILFIIVTLIPPLWLKSFLTRHIVIVAPIMMLISGLGINKLSQQIEKIILKKGNFSFAAGKISYIILGLMISLSLGWLNQSLLHPSQNREYNLTDFVRPLSAIKSDIKERKSKNPKLVSKLGYFAYFADIDFLVMPYTDYPGLVMYCKLNKVDYLLLNFHFQAIKDYPFVQEFLDYRTPNFKMMYEGKTENNKNLIIYRFDAE